jgi:hypothetical protein
MGVPWIVLAVLLALVVVVALVMALRGRRAPGTDLAAVETTSPSMRSEPGVAAGRNESAVDLETVMADAGATLYIPIDSGRKYLAVAHPDARVEGRTSSVPSQLVGAAVAGQAGLEALVKAGQRTGRLVVVDPATAKAIKAGAMVTDKAGQMLGVIRGSDGLWSGLTRIKPHLVAW